MLINAPVALGFAALRLVAAGALAIADRRSGAKAWFQICQALSDLVLTLGVVAYADPAVAVRWGPFLYSLAPCAVLWELVAIKLRWELWPPKPDQTSLFGEGALLPLSLLWGLAGVLLPALMTYGALAALQNSRWEAGPYVVTGIAMLIWAARAEFSDHPRARRILYSAVGILLLSIGVAWWVA
jgi:hypothetical protein